MGVITPRIDSSHGVCVCHLVGHCAASSDRCLRVGIQNRNVQILLAESMPCAWFAMFHSTYSVFCTEVDGGAQHAGTGVGRAGARMVGAGVLSHALLEGVTFQKRTPSEVVTFRRCHLPDVFTFQTVCPCRSSHLPAGVTFQKVSPSRNGHPQLLAPFQKL